MAQYSAGTITATNGSQTITGDGTAWQTAGLTAGDGIIIDTGIVYTIATVDSETQITLAANYAGSTGSGKSYTIHTDFTTNYNLPLPQRGDVETATIVKRALELIDTQLKSLDDRVTTLEP